MRTILALICFMVSLHSFEAKKYEYLTKKKSGFEPELLNIHFRLYEGYVKQANFLQAQMEALQGTDSFMYQSVKRRYGWEYDGMVLHELYFDNLGGDGNVPKNSPLYRKIVSQFGSYDKWLKDLKSTALIRGIGWVILYYDPVTEQLTNAWIQEHASGPLVNNTPILVIDLWEHAYLCQFKLDRTAYMDAVLDFLDWDVINNRYKQARRH